MLIYANPSSTRPRRARATKKGEPMAKRRKVSHKRRAVSRRRVHHNPAPRIRSERSPIRRARRAVSRGASNFLGELASKDGMILLASAAAAPAVVNLISEKLVPAQYKLGWTGILAKAGITIGLAYVVDRYAKQRKAAIGIAAGGLGVIISDAVNFYRVTNSVPSAPVAVQDQISKNPAMLSALVDGDYNSLNGYAMAPMAGYEMAPMGEDYDALN
jgi:hypothetical protein